MGTVGDSHQVTEMVLKALRLGYRHIDTVSPFDLKQSMLLLITKPGLQLR